MFDLRSVRNSESNCSGVIFFSNIVLFLLQVLGYPEMLDMAAEYINIK